MYNLPQETGLYWARRDSDSDWLYVALIKGVKPFLTYTLWNTEYPDNEHNNYDRTNLKNLMFSDRVHLASEEAALNNDVINRIYVEKSGLYVIKTRKNELAYIKGETPYLTCWIWNTLNDEKYKHLMPEDLFFVEYIEKPE